MSPTGNPASYPAGSSISAAGDLHSDRVGGSSPLLPHPTRFPSSRIQNEVLAQVTPGVSPKPLSDSLRSTTESLYLSRKPLVKDQAFPGVAALAYDFRNGEAGERGSLNSRLSAK